MSRFLDALNSGGVLLMDGAMGTELQRAGLQPGESAETWNVTRPERVRAVHRVYAEAGASVCQTNTFLAHNQPDRLTETVAAGIGLARETSPADGFVLGAIGPFNADQVDVARLIAAFAGVDGIAAETWTDRAAFEVLLRARTDSSVPLLISVTYVRDSQGRLTTFHGDRPEDWAAWATSWAGVAALGVNCGRDVGMTEVIEIVRRYRTATALPLFARPNAGTPEQTGDQWIYPHSATTMAARLPELLEAGATMIGGCCGTTPGHIAALRRVVDEWNSSR
jgi:methionine synthase I (cobalamin-dependent)